MGKLVDVDMSDSKEAADSVWASPVFIAEKVGDMLGRVVCDYEIPNKESEDTVSPPPDARVLTFEAALPPTGKAACNVTVAAGVRTLACA